jgi:tRNA threonylcarbamoyladenosine biosynthesis protein TsaE
MDRIVVESLDGLNKAAKSVLKALGSNRIVCLYGSMGAGKTTFIQSLCKELGVTDNVVSPTFAIVNEYNSASGTPIYHFDFYRIKRIEEVFDFGYEEYFYTSKGYCFIEWPELIEEILPDNGVIRFSIKVQPDGSRAIEKLGK